MPVSGEFSRGIDDRRYLARQGSRDSCRAARAIRPALNRPVRRADCGHSTERFAAADGRKAADHLLSAMQLKGQQSHVGRQAFWTRPGPDRTVVTYRSLKGTMVQETVIELVAMNTVTIAAFSVILAILPLASTASAGNAPISDALPSLRPDVQCMVNVLGTAPGVDHVRSGVSQTDGHTEAFVEYRYHESNGHLDLVRFVAYQSANSKNSVQFVAALNGLMTPGSPGPPDFAAVKVTRLWKLKCDVSAYELFE
jgi:hypothetical protein